MRHLLLLALLLLPLPALAQGWNTSSAGTGSSRQVVNGGDSAFYRFTSAVDSAGLSISGCGSADVHFNEGTASQIHIYKCLDSGIADVTTSSSCTKHLVDKDGDGTLDDETLDGSLGRTGYSFVQGIWLYVNVIVSSGTSVVGVACHR